MPLSDAAAAAQAKELMKLRAGEAQRLDLIHGYLRDDLSEPLRGIPQSAPREVHELARIARVNVIKYAVNARVQASLVDGYRTPRANDDLPVWSTWRRNKMNARQTGLHRAAVGYGAAYLTVLQGEPIPVMRGVSPRDMTAAYGDDDVWPVYALERRRSGWRLYDITSVYDLQLKNGEFTVVKTWLHNARMFGEPVCPVVRYRDTDDLDHPVSGLVEPLIMLQDQINITTFGLLVAQHFGAFRQRVIMGWMAETETERLKASASALWEFDDPDVKVHEFSETNLKGYIESREASLRHMATVSQTPAHELTGQLINLSADALAAAQEGHLRAVDENHTVLGESHEQGLGLAAEYQGETVDPLASVRWRDVGARSLAAVADGLGKLSVQLKIPPQALWEKIPGVTDDDLKRWERLAKEGDALGNMQAMLDKHADAVPAGVPSGALA